MCSYPSSMQVSNRCLIMLSDAVRQHRNALRTRWRRLGPGQQALLVLAHLRKGETYRDLAEGFGIGTSTVYRYLREGLELLAAMAPTLDEAIAVARRKAFVILDGTLLRIDRAGMTGGHDRPYYSGKHKAHGLNVQVIADPAGRLVWVSPALPGSRHDIAAARARHPRRHRQRRHPRRGRHRLPGRRPERGRTAAAPPPRPGHRRLPATFHRAEGGQHRPRPAARTRRASQRPAEELEGPAQDPRQPEPGHHPDQSRADTHPRRLIPTGNGSVSLFQPG